MAIMDVNLVRQNIINLKAVAVTPVTNLIDKFNISADSVVATVEIKVKNGVTKFHLDWGDGQVSRIDLRSSVAIHYGSTTILEDGTYSLQHAYNVSDDGLQFQMLAMLTAFKSDNQSEIRIYNVAIRPKYQVWYSDVMVRLVDTGDFAENVSEWEIEQRSTRIVHTAAPYYEDIGGQLKWNFDIGQNLLPTPWYRLDGSRRSHSLFKNESMHSSFKILETDPIWDDDYYASIILHGGVPVEDEVQLRVGPMEIRYAQTMTLINRLRDFTPPLSL